MTYERLVHCHHQSLPYLEFHHSLPRSVLPAQWLSPQFRVQLRRFVTNSFKTLKIKLKLKLKKVLPTGAVFIHRKLHNI